MKTLLALIGSPRPLGNCELMAKEISRHFPLPHALQLARLPELDIRPCRACYQCLFRERGCVQEDDFPLLLEAIIQADALIVAAPTYLLSANSGLKKFLDRGLAFFPRYEELWGKPAVAVSVAGIEGMEGFTKLCLDSALRLLGTSPRGSAVVYGALPGEVFLHRANKEVACSLAEALAAPVPPATSPWCCPQCGGDTFRFLGQDRIRCMTCSSDGRLRLEAGLPQPDIHPRRDHFFLSLEAAQHHLRWLREMKHRFMAERERLRTVTGDYRNLGTWLRPSRAGAAGSPANTQATEKG